MNINASKCVLEYLFCAKLIKIKAFKQKSWKVFFHHALQKFIFDAELAHSDWLQHKLTFRCRASSLFDAAQAHYFMHINREGGKGLHFDYYELIINLLLLCLL